MALVVVAALAPATLRAGVPHGSVCAAHAAADAANQHTGHMEHAPAAPAATTVTGSTDCTHCPTGNCLGMSSCAGHAPALADALGPDVTPSMSATAAGPVWLPAFSLAGQPPTPPPSGLLSAGRG